GSLAGRPVPVGREAPQAGSGDPGPEQTELDVVTVQRFAEERISHQGDLPDRQVVRGTPPGVEGHELLIGGSVGRSVGPGRAGVHGDLLAWSAVLGRGADDSTVLPPGRLGEGNGPDPRRLRPSGDSGASVADDVSAR